MEAYRYLFPIGVFYAIGAAAVWILFRFDLISIYPARIHSLGMMGGFVYSFVFGFIWTSLPRFLIVDKPSRVELAGVFTPLSFGLIFLFALQSETGFLVCLLISFLATLSWGLHRYSKRKQHPPTSFVLMAIGLIWGIIAVSLQILSAQNLASIFFAEWSRISLHRGIVFLFIFGVGSRLIPMLSGLQFAPNTRSDQLSQKILSLPQTLGMKASFVFSGFIIGSSIIEAFGYFLLGQILALAAGIFFIFRMRLWNFPVRKNALAWSTWLATWSLGLSPIFPLVFSDQRIDQFHWYYIMGFVLLTVNVATRVMISHSGRTMEFEFKKIFYFIAGSILLAGLTRVTVNIVPEIRLNHLAYAAGLLILALGIWSFVFIRFTFNLVGSEKNDKC